MFIPKAVIAPAEMEYREAPGRDRPLTLATASQKLLAKAVNYMWEEVAMMIVSDM